MVIIWVNNDVRTSLDGPGERSPGDSLVRYAHALGSVPPAAQQEEDQVNALLVVGIAVLLINLPSD
jgi:hypothetical protein